MAQNESQGLGPYDSIDNELRPTPSVRPDDCDCGSWNASSDLPCWPCHRDGFEFPNPDSTEEDDGK